MGAQTRLRSRGIDPPLDGTTLLGEQGALADCGERPTLYVSGAATGVDARIARHISALGDLGPLRTVDGNAGASLGTTGSAGWRRGGSIDLSLDPIPAATDVWIESSDCPIEQPLDSADPIERTLHPETDLDACPGGPQRWVVAADDDGEEIAFRTPRPGE